MIATEKAGRVRTCSLNAETMRLAESWLGDQITLWEGRTERLAEYVETALMEDDP